MYTPGVIIPPLPEKSVVQKYQMTTDFIEQRRAALTLFINKVVRWWEGQSLSCEHAAQLYVGYTQPTVCRLHTINCTQPKAAHPVLKTSKDLQLFLEASEDEWSLEVSRAIAESNLSKPKFSGVAQIFKGLQHSTANLVAGRTDDEDEDPEYIKVREYINQLEAHLAEAHRQSARLIKRQAELGQAVQEWGKAMESLGMQPFVYHPCSTMLSCTGRFEDGAIADGCMHLSEKSDCLARMLSSQAHALGDSFEGPLKEFVRTIRAAKATIADRAAALAALSQARTDVEIKRGRLAKLRGTPGIREEKAAEAERELNEAQQRVEKAKKDFEGIAQRMAVELARFQRERAQEMAVVLRDFSVAQAQLSSDINNVWHALLPALTNIGA